MRVEASLSLAAAILNDCDNPWYFEACSEFFWRHPCEGEAATDEKVWLYNFSETDEGAWWINKTIHDSWPLCECDKPWEYDDECYGEWYRDRCSWESLGDNGERGWVYKRNGSGDLHWVSSEYWHECHDEWFSICCLF